MQDESYNQVIIQDSQELVNVVRLQYYIFTILLHYYVTSILNSMLFIHLDVVHNFDICFHNFKYC
jgi:hypothetical protein